MQFNRTYREPITAPPHVPATLIGTPGQHLTHLPVPTSKSGPPAGATCSNCGALTTQPRFLTVATTARAVSISKETLHRAIRDDEFPAIKVRGRYVIPACLLDELEAAAVARGALVDVAIWMRERGAV